MFQYTTVARYPGCSRMKSCDAARRRRSITTSGVVFHGSVSGRYSSTPRTVRHEAGSSGSVRASSLYVPAIAVPNWVVTGTNARNSTALRIVHGATTSSATAISTAGGPSERHGAHTTSASGTSRISAVGAGEDRQGGDEARRDRRARREASSSAPSISATNSGSDIERPSRA